MPVDLTPFPEDGLAQLETWLAARHVARWWRQPWTGPVITALRDGTPVPGWIRPWRIELDGRPIGYAQDYDVTQDAGTWGSEKDVFGPGTRGIDLLIGEADVVNRKHGQAAIRTLASRLFAEVGIERLVSDPHPDNWACIIAFKRAGFRERGRRQFPGGPVMLLTAAKAIWRG